MLFFNISIYFHVYLHQRHLKIPLWFLKGHSNHGQMIYALALIGNYLEIASRKGLFPFTILGWHKERHQDYNLHETSVEAQLDLGTQPYYNSYVASRSNMEWTMWWLTLVFQGLSLDSSPKVPMKQPNISYRKSFREPVGDVWFSWFYYVIF